MITSKQEFSSRLKELLADLRLKVSQVEPLYAVYRDECVNMLKKAAREISRFRTANWNYAPDHALFDATFNRLLYAILESASISHIRYCCDRLVKLA